MHRVLQICDPQPAFTKQHNEILAPAEVEAFDIYLFLSNQKTYRCVWYSTPGNFSMCIQVVGLGMKKIYSYSLTCIINDNQQTN